MSTLLQSYEEEYRETTKKFNDDINAIRATLKTDASNYTPPPATGPGSRVHHGSSATSALAHLRELLSNMEYECHTLPAALRQSAKERIADYRSSVTKLEETLSSVKQQSSEADRKDVLGNKGANKEGDKYKDLDDETKKHRMMMMDNTEKVRQASKKLTQSERLLNETEVVGNEALTNLRSQTETLNRIHETTIAVDEEVSDARKILIGMQKTMIKHKLMLFAVIGVLILLIVVAVYVGVSKSKSNQSVTAAPVTDDPIKPQN